ncbi:hypothetical protein K431DRAFT_229249 [Polychaeton citri CBS 116435]|uniref:Hamartin n=1 Tax=Polychaeton citri CBS 116435 TaxID=1314669 RepID=A0A9P4Q646_9PEZI|nr:hypothetical protein K431DRAFT_229249 [Polychaeton citri CBS 116435]
MASHSHAEARLSAIIRSHKNADVTGHRTMKEAIKALQGHYQSQAKTLSLPSEVRRLLQTFVEEHDGDVSQERVDKLNDELRTLWEKSVKGHPQKYLTFVGVLKELQPVIGNAKALDWWRLVVKPVICSEGSKQQAHKDALEYLVNSMVYDAEEDDSHYGQEELTKSLCKEMLDLYIEKTTILSDSDPLVAPENGIIAQHVEAILVAFGRKQPKELFHALDELIVRAGTRLQALTLLSSFLRHQAPHLYLVINTPLIEHLLKSLMNDLSITVISVALTSLIMLMPHIPGSLSQHLPRMFLVYSQLVCWEKFSPLSTEMQRSLVTDDRIDVSSSNFTDHGDVGIDPSWERARPKEGVVEADTPELLTYFTYLYGLYPLNLMSYVRKPRRYLKNVNFPGADDFDLDQSVIRARTEQFQQCHLLHPNFFNMTVEDELSDPKWPKMDPADVVGDCHGLCINTKPSLTSPGPPPSGRLPDIPTSFPALTTDAESRHRDNSNLSPSASHASFRTGNGGRETPSTTVSATGDPDSPILKPQAVAHGEFSRPSSQLDRNASIASGPSLSDFPLPGHFIKEKAESIFPSNVAYYEQQVTLLKNELNFEKWHKAQYSEHISQLSRKNIRDATIDAELLNLTNANRALKQQLDHLAKAREITAKDAAMTRKQASSAETYLNERLAKMKTEQEKWRSESDELNRLRTDTKQLRELLVNSESRELNSTHRLETMQRDLDKLQDMQARLDQAKQRLAEYEYREFEFERTQRGTEVLENQLKLLQSRLSNQQDENERMQRAYSDRISELEVPRDTADRSDSSVMSRPSPSTQALIQQANHDSQIKLAQLKKAHIRLLDKFTDLELENQALKSHLEDGSPKPPSRFDDSSDRWMFGQRNDRTSMVPTSLGSAYEAGSFTDLDAFSNSPKIVSKSDPSGRRYQQPLQSPPLSANEATMHDSAGLTWKPPSSHQVSRSVSSRTKGSDSLVTYNRTAPLRPDEAASLDSNDSRGKKEKITPNSEMRVYGRGGAQNIKLKNKDKAEAGEKPSKVSFLRGFSRS